MTQGFGGRVAIVGAGQAGAALAHGLRRAGYDVVAVASRSPESAATLAEAVGAAPMSRSDAVAAASLVLLTVPDDIAADVALGIADLDDVAGKRFLHTSGVLDLDVLDPLAAAGAETGVLHPVTPLIPPDAEQTLRDKPIGCDAADPEWVASIATALGGRPVQLAGVSRPLYHAAASMAANLVVGLAGAALRAFEDAGVTEADAQALVGSLLSATAANVSAHGPHRALTGPARRGDAEVLRRHMEALAAADPELAETYRMVSRRILDLMPRGEARTRSEEALK